MIWSSVESEALDHTEIGWKKNSKLPVLHQAIVRPAFQKMMAPTRIPTFLIDPNTTFPELVLELVD
jgi:hypothetical protein